MKDDIDATAAATDGGVTRRQVFTAAAAAPVVLAASGTAIAEAKWYDGSLRHIIPAANHERFRIKASLTRAIPGEAVMLIGGRRVVGTRGDSEGRFWTFDVSGLRPDTSYLLQIQHEGRPLCGSWPLRTFPAPGASPKSFRLLTFTCAGGHEDQRGPDGAEVFRPMEIRRRLLARALSFAPQAAIANGDHIYWDQLSGYDALNPSWAKGWKTLYSRFIPLDRHAQMTGGRNEQAIKQLGDPQIAALYGTSLRSVPSYFLGDDHDYFENDEANDRFVTFPPDEFMVRAKQAVQQLYYPEMLPDPARPVAMSGTHEDGLSENFGTLRYGRLFEALLYDCGRWLDLKGKFGRIVPEDAEDWLIARTKATDTRHLLHVPSTPMGWSAGKWREWYPDIVVDDSRKAADGTAQQVQLQTGATATRLTTEKPKFMWQAGWHAQHQRLMAALTGNKARPAVMVSGDLHAVGWEKIARSGDLDMTANPVYSILAGPLGSSEWAWPSKFRGIHAVPPGSLTVDDGVQPIEKNGFTIIDVDDDAMTVRLFAWREPQPIEDIDRLEPFATLRIPRQST